MKLGSFCTGYGGLDMAVEAHFDATLAWYSEVDKDCNQLLAHYWPGVPNLGDLTTVDWDQVEPVDIMCAGFPCTPFSTAGQQRGSDDERAIFPFIADALSVLRPSVVCLENVAAFTGFPHGRGGGVDVLATLTGLGFDNIRWGIVRASDAGAPHRRARWFCIAEASDTEGAERRTAEHETVGATVGSAAELGERHSATPADAAALGPQSVRPERRLEEASGEPRRLGRFGAYEPAIERWERILGRPAPDPTDDRGLRPAFVSWMMGLPEGWVTTLGLSRTAELKMLGNGVVPQQASLALEILDG